MITAIIGASILTMFGVMFHLENRDGGGVYDPDPRPKKRK
jgi:hypothetical protein